MSGRNDYPNPDNYPQPSFPSSIDAPVVDPDEGNLITVQYSEAWVEVLMAAVDQLIQYAAWNGDSEAKKLAADRADNLKYLLQENVYADVPTPFWDDETDLEDEAPADDQRWYGGVTNPEAPAGELDFVESAALWIITGIVAIATFEVGGIAPAIAFHTTVEKFIILQKRRDVAATIRFVIDGEDAKFVNTAPYSEGDIIETKLVTPQTGGDHTILIIETE